ncbi:unnamed protein product [Medioppia subpectinata]|uniref:Cytochrome P450 n=1 Tax=Medioppia subpectinata TaxID=1979941 RepID=A0A7R9KSZ7_9ACAR|nr:unnamed protein product [Medioppia subpectinata]CAG2108955.1 unnamed protein product [Medioppia subpectinata]
MFNTNKLINYQNVLSLPMVITIIIGLIVYYIIHFYANLRHYPPGPTPLPFIGNILLFRNIKRHLNEDLRQLYDIYGPVVTVWVGPKPVVIVGDPHVVKQAFSRPEFMGRMDNMLSSILCDSEHRDLLLNSHISSWESLRKVAHIAVRLDLEYFTKFKYYATGFLNDMDNTFILCEYIPVCRLFMSDPLAKFRTTYNQCFDYTLNVLKTHKNTYDESVCRDFCDVYIGAKRKAEVECLPGVQWLTNNNIAASLMDVAVAGTETTYTTIQWMVLFVAYFENWHQKLMVEIDEVLGHRVATMADRPRMHCVNAFIAETLRYRTAAPLGYPRVTLSDTTIST